MIDIHDYYEENEVYFVDFDDEKKFPISVDTLIEHIEVNQLNDTEDGPVCPVNYLRDNTLEVISNFLNSITI